MKKRYSFSGIIQVYSKSSGLLLSWFLFLGMIIGAKPYPNCRGNVIGQPHSGKKVALLNELITGNNDQKINQTGLLNDIKADQLGFNNIINSYPKSRCLLNFLGSINCILQKNSNSFTGKYLASSTLNFLFVRGP